MLRTGTPATSRDRRYDLHTHSVYSDGTTSPGAIAEEAAGLGLAGFALTDHDTVDGWDAARAASEEHGVDFLPGMEITTRHRWRSTHLLAYGPDLGRGRLSEEIAEVRRSRVERAREMVRLISADYRISWESVIGDGDASTVGRPHIADALVVAGYFPHRSAVFSDLLRPGSPYYIDTYALETLDTIRMVREAGGVPVLAHPAAGRSSRPVDPAALRSFAEAGLWGIELSHPENRAEWIPGLREQAGELGLVATGASDYHGAGKANRLGECTSGAEVVEAVRALAAVPR
ncbi:PHP domain-containing protein [Leucobacter sp. CSA1]|uniref:PHP domain-containing protein n=1 Tax=Leucobacter chromiisoli TaxID=2796471 RepID=A0A934UVU1_9MICO|nr:PHP domain-containing protein [Leucobacter chromiisoli]MBK0419252.1 PHP domain-containing protein [Leucobacter chromiisoli]